MKAISEVRSELMGLAIVWIMLYHMGVKLPLVLAPLTVIKMMGLTGVDMFFLMSGMGLAFSWHHCADPVRFMQKRLARILPIFWVMVMLSLLRDAQLGILSQQDAWRFTGLDFIAFGQLDRWFVPAIIVCYGLFLLIQQIAVKLGLHAALLMVLAIAIGMDIYLPGSKAAHLLILSVRLPVFLLGVLLGHHLIDGHMPAVLKRGAFQWAWLSMALLSWLAVNTKVPNQLAWAYGLWWYPTALLAYPICALASRWLQSLATEGAVRRWLRTCGQCSLELYLIHEFVYSLAPYLPLKVWQANIWRLPEFLLYFALSAMLAMRAGPVFARLKLS